MVAESMDLVELEAEKRAAEWAKIEPDLGEEVFRRGFMRGVDELDMPEHFKQEVRKGYYVPEGLLHRIIKEFEMKEILREDVYEVMMREEELRVRKLQKLHMNKLMREDELGETTMHQEEPRSYEREVRLEIQAERVGEFKIQAERVEEFNMFLRNKSLVAIGVMLSAGAVLMISGFLFHPISLPKWFQIACWQTATVSFFAAWLAVWDHFGSVKLPLRKDPR